MRASPVILLLSAALGLHACSTPERASVSDIVLVAAPAPAPDLPAARWDHKPQAEVWTETALAALDGHASDLVEITPADIETWCPGYTEADEETRKAFWVGLISALAKHESTWRPKVSGGEGRWHGLLQISPATARGYGCRATSPDALKVGPANLNCGLRIMSNTVVRDGVVARGGGGVAADWGPFRQPQKRSDMVSWMRAQSYCRG